MLFRSKTIERCIKESRAREEESRAREELKNDNNEEIVESVKMEEQESEKPTHELNNEKETRKKQTVYRQNI